jgi:ribosomal protein S4
MPADSLHKGLVRMAWGARNLYSLWRLTYNPPDHLAKNLSFKSTPMTLYQQKWVSKRMLRAYHGDWIQERRLRRRFMPDALPPLQANARGGGGGSTAEEASRNASTASNASDFGGRDATKDNRRIPLASLMWREVEARLDVLLFRACFTHSAYDARRMITQGHVKLNGKTVSFKCLLISGSLAQLD